MDIKYINKQKENAATLIKIEVEQKPLRKIVERYVSKAEYNKARDRQELLEDNCRAAADTFVNYKKDVDYDKFTYRVIYI